MKKLIKVVLIAFLIPLILGGCMSKKVSINLIEDVELSIFGMNGSGRAKVGTPKINFDASGLSNDEKSNIDEFLDQVKYICEPEEKIKNGDYVTVTAQYSKELAEKYNIEVIEFSKEIKAENLIERANSANELTKEIVAPYIDKSISIMKSDFDDKIAPSVNIDNAFSLQSIWLAKSDEKDKLCFIYKMKGYDILEKVEKDYWIYITYNSFYKNESSNINDIKNYWGYGYLYKNLMSGDTAKNNNEAIVDLKYRLRMYDLTEFKLGE